MFGYGFHGGLLEIKMRKISTKGLKKKAWAVFAKVMRNKGAVNGNIKCITCPRIYPVGDSAWNAGHFKHGKWKMSGFYENNVWPQCVFDNCGGGRNGGGDMIAELYELALVEKLGEEEVDKIKALSKKIWKPTKQQLEEIIAKYSIDTASQ